MIFITGCARSGTSLTTQILEAHGVDIGRDRARLNGLNENVDIREKIVKPYLKRLGVDPLGQKPLPDETRLAPRPGWREDITCMMKGATEPWAYKCAKLVLIWPLWKEHFPEAKYIIVRRDREKIIDSCIRTSFMRGHQNREGWGKWVDEHVRRFEGMRREFDCIEVWPDEFIREPEAFRPVAEHCNLAFDARAVRSNLDKSKWH